MSSTLARLRDRLAAERAGGAPVVGGLLAVAANSLRWRVRPIVRRVRRTQLGYWATPSRRRLPLRGLQTGSGGPSCIDVFSAAHGQEFGEMLSTTCLPSLFDPAFRAYCAGRRVRVNIYCVEEERAVLEDGVERALRDTGYELTFDTSFLRADGDNRGRLPAAFKHQLAAARDVNALVIMAMPDHVFGRGLADVIARTREGEYVVCGHPRISIEAGFEQVKRLVAADDYDNGQLVSLFVESIPHRVVSFAKTGRHDYLELRGRPYGWDAYFKEPPPLLFWGSFDLIEQGFANPFFGEFECLDHDIPDLMLRHGLLRAIDDSEVFFWAEFTSDTKYPDMLANQWWAPSALLLRRYRLRWHAGGVRVAT